MTSILQRKKQQAFYARPSLQLDIHSGLLLLNDCPLSIQTEQAFLDSLPNKDTFYNHTLQHRTYNHHQTYSMDIRFIHMPFSLNLTFFDGVNIYHTDKSYGVGLSWQSGLVYQKGYDSSIKDIIKDIEKLGQLLEKELLTNLAMTTTKPLLIEPEIEPDCHTRHYKFDWGKIICGGVLKTPTVSISIIVKPSS